MEDRPGGRKERIRSMLLRREHARLNVRFKARKKRQDTLKLSNVENKRLSASTAGAATRYTLTTGTFTLLNGLQTGFNTNNRLGRRIKIHRVYHSAAIQANAANQTTVARWILFYDKAPNGAAPVVADLLDTTTSITQSPYNEDNRWRFSIICDAKVGCDDAGDNPSLTYCDEEVCYYTEYNANNFGDIRDITTGALYIFRCADDAVAYDISAYSMYFMDL